MDNKLKRLEGESELEFIARAYREKDSLGVTCQELATMINKELGTNYAESTMRSSIAKYINIGIDIGYEKGINENNSIDENEVLSELDIKKFDLYKEKVKMQDQRRELNKLLRDVARQETLKDTMIDCAKMLCEKDPIIINKDICELNSDQVGVVLLSDFHCGEVVSNYFNTYDTKIFLERLSKLKNRVIKFGNMHQIEKLIILDLGDNINGNIHVSTRVSSEIDVVEQTMFVAESFSKLFSDLAEEFNEVESYHVLDNHARVNKNKKEHIEKENFGKIVSWFIRERLKNVSNFKVVENEVDDGIGVVNILGRDSFFVHGHLDSPNRVTNTLPKLLKIIPECIFMAHIHHHLEKDDGIELVVNPSGMGVNNYARDGRFAGKAGQKFLIFDREERIIADYRINF